jgi:ParB-like chromosome segregation protein Spo0J
MGQWLVHNSDNCISTISPNNLFRSHGLSGAPDTREIIDLANDMKARGWQGDPILVVKRADGSLVVADGHHRLAAAKLVGLKEIPYKVVEDISELSHTSWKSLAEVLSAIPESNKLDTKLLEKAGLISKSRYRGRR